jgi:hypothetical protein
MSDVPDIAVGLTYTHVGIAQTFEIRGYTLPNGEIEVINISHQGTTGAFEKMPADLYDAGEFRFFCAHDQDFDYFSELGTDSGDAGAVITCPSGATITFRGIFQSYVPQAAELNGEMLAEVTVAVSKTPVVAGA